MTSRYTPGLEDVWHAGGIGGIVSLLAVPAFAASTLTLSADYERCMQRSNGVDPAMQACISAESERQDKQLNEAYRKLMAQLPPDRKKQLQEVQRLWIKYTDANCGFYFDPDGGTIARLSANTCLMNARAARARELRELMP